MNDTDLIHAIQTALAEKDIESRKLRSVYPYLCVTCADPDIVIAIEDTEAIVELLDRKSIEQIEIHPLKFINCCQTLSSEIVVISLPSNSNFLAGNFGIL